MPEEVVSPQDEEKAQELTQEMAEDSAQISEELEQEQTEEAEEKEEMVPLSALKKERKKRQEREQQLEYERQQYLLKTQSQPQEESYEDYESLTRKDLAKIQEETIRMVDEKHWIRQNQERYEYVNENLKDFLEERPHLASAIQNAPNRYEEAWMLMNALSPKQRQQMQRATAPKKEAPNSPSAMPKAAAMDQSVDLMSMSDEEYLAWRKAQKRRGA